MNIVFRRIGFAIENVLTTQFVARLPLFMCNYFLKKIQKIMYNNDVSLESIDIIF
jgi:hypothetical protein